MKNIVLILLFIICNSVFSQPRQQFSGISNAKLASIPNFVLQDKYKDRTAYPLPSRVDNLSKKYMPPYSTWCIQGWSCAVATALYCFNYEINRIRDVASSGNYPQYPYLFAYEFLNSGNIAEGGDGWMFVDAFDIFKENGNPTSADYGGFEWGYTFAGWMSGYDKYYNAMKNKVEEYYKIDASKDSSIELIKQYLYDCGDGSSTGGILCFQANSENWTISTVPSISKDAGKRIFSRLGGGGGHALNIVGYDDEVGYDFNGDGKLTNPGTDVSMWEKGSFILLNNWGDGWYYAPYRLFSGKISGGLATSQGIPVMYCKIKKNYSPILTFKISITHNQRNNIQLIYGFANSSSATSPTKTFKHSAAFNYAGGAFPMCGRNQSSTIEIGIDLTNFVSDITGNEAKFFLQVASKGGTGQVNSLSLLDYSGSTPKEFKCLETNKPIVSGSTLTMSVLWSGTITNINKDYKNNHKSSKYFLAYPNIANRFCKNIKFSFVNSSCQNLEIKDIIGHTIFSKSINPDEKEFLWNLKTSNNKRISPGIYIATLTDNQFISKKEHVKFIINE